jgi:hypothetical protein
MSFPSKEFDQRPFNININISIDHELTHCEYWFWHKITDCWLSIVDCRTKDITVVSPRLLSFPLLSYTWCSSWNRDCEEWAHDQQWLLFDMFISCTAWDRGLDSKHLFLVSAKSIRDCSRRKKIIIGGKRISWAEWSSKNGFETDNWPVCQELSCSMILPAEMSPLGNRDKTSVYSWVTSRSFSLRDVEYSIPT